jgi:hypothetical protein
MRKHIPLTFALGAAALVACTEPEPEPTFDGTWSLTWACDEGCDLWAPPVAQSDVVEVAGASLSWSYAAWLVHDGTRDGDCIDVPGGNDSAVRHREPYTLCWDAATDTISTSVWEIGGPDSVQTRWSLAGSR